MAHTAPTSPPYCPRVRRPRRQHSTFIRKKKHIFSPSLTGISSSHRKGANLAIIDCSLSLFTTSSRQGLRSRYCRSPTAVGGAAYNTDVRSTVQQCNNASYSRQISPHIGAIRGLTPGIIYASRDESVFTPNCV